MYVIIYPEHLSLDVVAIGVTIHCNSRTTDFNRTFRVIPAAILVKHQRRLSNKLVQKIQCTCIKNVDAFGNSGWNWAAGSRWNQEIKNAVVGCLSFNHIYLSDPPNICRSISIYMQTLPPRDRLSNVISPVMWLQNVCMSTWFQFQEKLSCSITQL